MDAGARRHEPKLAIADCILALLQKDDYRSFLRGAQQRLKIVTPALLSTSLKYLTQSAYCCHFGKARASSAWGSEPRLMAECDGADGKPPDGRVVSG
eukprot:3743605-Amphidinium_carterae.1